MKKYVAIDDLLKHQRKMRGFGLSSDEEFWDFAVLVEDINNTPAAKVVVTPCNVGDPAYMVTDTGHIRHLTVISIDIKLRKNETDMVIWAVGEIDGAPNCYIQIIPSKIGEIYFFSLKDAEEALKERKKEND